MIPSSACPPWQHADQSGACRECVEAQPSVTPREGTRSSRPVRRGAGSLGVATGGDKFSGARASGARGHEAADGPLPRHSSTALMAFSPQIAPLERFALWDGSKSPMKGEVKRRGRGSIVQNTPAGTSPFMGEGGRGPSQLTRATGRRAAGERSLRSPRQGQKLSRDRGSEGVAPLGRRWRGGLERRMRIGWPVCSDLRRASISMRPSQIRSTVAGDGGLPAMASL